MDQFQTEGYAAFLGARRAHILDLINQAASRSGRDASEVTLLAVSKTVGPEEVALAHEAGYDVFGENRPQELTRKLAALSELPQMDGVRFDMIGNLQKNKINQVLGQASLIHSVSSTHLAEAISSRAVTRQMVAQVLLEVNVSGEASKSGFAPTEVTEAMEGLVALPGIAIQGLMTMAPAGDPDEARRTFSGLRELVETLRNRSGLPLGVLSCGMSDDFPIAVEEGSTLVRLGRTVFDPAYGLA